MSSHSPTLPQKLENANSLVMIISMNAEELTRIGINRYGLRWKPMLAKEMGVSPRYLQLLAAGQKPITQKIEASLMYCLQTPRDTYFSPEPGWSMGLGILDFVQHDEFPKFMAIFLPANTRYPSPLIPQETLHIFSDKSIVVLKWEEDPTTLYGEQVQRRTNSWARKAQAVYRRRFKADMNSPTG